MNTRKLLLTIHALQNEVRKFEEKYGMLSKAFYERYESGAEPEDDEWVADFSIWAGHYTFLQQIEAEYLNSFKQLPQNQNGTLMMIPA